MQQNKVKAFQEWLAKPLGQLLVDQQKNILKSWIDKIFGFHLLFLGEIPFLSCLDKCSILHRIWIHPQAKKNKECSAVVARQDKLPIIPDEMDLIYLAHCLEFNKNPHEVLREAYSALRPEGYLLISGFNPWSFWGLSRLFFHFINPKPWDGDFISIRRMKDWLALLGVEILEMNSCLAGFPIEHVSVLKKFSWLQNLFQFLFPLRGGCYMILAQKKLAALTPIRPRFAKRKRLVAAGWVEPVTRN